MRVVLVRSVVIVAAVVLAVVGSDRVVGAVATLAAAACLVVIALLVRSVPTRPDVAAVDVRAPTASGTRAPPAADPRALSVGSASDGSPVGLDAATGIVVVGRGALAVGVFVALAAELGRCATGDDELRTVGPSAGALPDGVAVAVVVDQAGQRVGSVVLVPDLRSTPRQPSPTIDVTRYGCAVRSDPDARASTRVLPRLPVLDGPAAPP